MPLSLDDGAFVVGVPNDFARDWIDKRFAGMVAEALGEVLGDPVEVSFVVDARVAALPHRRDRHRASVCLRCRTMRPVRRRLIVDPEKCPRSQAPGNLNQRYVFERFVEGPHNQYAAAVARSVAESPATAYNPVFIYADTGLGKTHLIQAIAHATLLHHPDLQVKYIDCRALHG